MKTKGISFWEQNIERLVLGLALLVCVVLVAMQFLGEPNAVNIAGKSVSPGDVDQQLTDRAKAADAAMDARNDHEFGKAVAPVLARLDDRMNSFLAPEKTLTVWAPPIGIGRGTGVVGDRPFRNPKIPTPTNAIARQFFDTIPEEVADATDGLKTLIGATAAPYDVTWATPSAKFPVAELIQQFTTDGPDGEAALLRAWHNNRADFIDVKVERQEYVDGEWKNDTLLGPLPGYFSFRTELKDKVIDDSLRHLVLSTAVEPAIRAQIIQPPFYATLTESWVPPGSKAADALNIRADDPAAAEKQERAELQKRLEAVIKSLKERGCPETPPAKPEPKKPEPKAPKSSGGGTAAPGSGVGGDKGAGANGGELRGAGSGAINLAACEAAWRRRSKLEAQIAQIDAEIAKIENKEPDKPVEVVEVADEIEEVIDIWAHDLTIVPGKTYRYRFTVEVYNPLFGRKLTLIPEQQVLAEQFTLSSEASEWSEPMTAQPPLRLFVTQAFASNQSSVGLPVGQATAEVYRFHNGRWWAEPFRLTPGSRVGDQKSSRSGASVDYGTDWFVLDVVPTLGADAQDEKNGYGAVVMLQSLSDPSKIEWRIPMTDMSDPERRQLIGRVKLAELGGDSIAANLPGDSRTGGDSGSATN